MSAYREVAKKWKWYPIKNCPGRYVLDGGAQETTIQQLLGQEVTIREYQLEIARDTVLVVELSGGGVISYRKPNGLYVHTLCNSDGFERKLKQLGIG